MKKSFIIALNIGYWVMYLLLLLMFMMMLSAGAIKTTTPKQEMIFGFFKVMSVMTILPGLISFYFFYHFIFSRFLTRKKIVHACIYGVSIAVLCGILGFIGLGLMSNGSMFSRTGLKEISIMTGFMSALCLVHGIIALIIKGFISWYGDIKFKEALQQKNFETELALVKLQLNPHFLFNTINNIDVLIEKDATKASLYLNKLSDIMRFMLYESKTDRVPLEKELSYISKYIDLQKIRNANPDYIKYSITGNPGGSFIASMLFIPFIENAFKHAAGKKKENGITIGIDIEKERILFHCCNYYELNPLEAVEPGGLGNELMRKRLNLLYPGRHELRIIQKDDLYTVNLIVDNTGGPF